ncbi:MAG: hypothetical protein ACI3ZK_07310 [Candidatus Cryptobacteroides sp.]
MKKIVYKGQELPCRITMGAMVRFKKASGRDVSTIQNGDISDLILLLWCCIKSACNADEIPFDTPFELFADSLDAEALQDFITGLAAGAEDGQKKSPEEAK